MKRKRLLWQLFPSYLLITLIALAAVSWFASSELQQFYLEEAALDLKTRATLLEPTIRTYLNAEPPDAAAVDRLCKDAARDAGIRMTVILPDGRVVGDSYESPHRMDNHGNRPEIVAARDTGRGRSTRFDTGMEQRMIFIAVPVRHEDRLIAFLRTALPITGIDEEIRTIQYRIGFAGLMIAILSAGISLLITRRISRPIEQMRQGAERFAEGSLEHRLAVPDSLELGALAETLNRMAAQLDDRIRVILQQRNELETVLESMSEGVVAVDMDEHVISMNRAAAGMFRTPLVDYHDRTVQEVIRNSDLLRFIREALGRREKLEGDIHLYQNGERILYTHSTSLRDPVGRPIGILVVLNDVTELRRLESMRRDFVANVSHEIKTPLTAIKGFVETLRGGGVEAADEIDRFLAIINKHVDRLAEIIEDLLKLSRIEREDESGTIRYMETPVRRVIQSAASICQPKAESRRIALDMQCDESLTAPIDPSLVEQAVVNLLDNAIKYSRDDSRVRIAAGSENGEVVIQVRDDGIGIAREHLPRLFERFYRVDKARSRKLGGTGLGLSIVKHIIQAHGGRVSVDSEAGRGSTFRIHLPK